MHDNQPEKLCTADFCNLAILKFACTELTWYPVAMAGHSSTVMCGGSENYVQNIHVGDKRVLVTPINPLHSHPANTVRLYFYLQAH